MRLTSHTDYSLRVLIYLALNGDRRSNVSEIAARFRISRNHLVKVIHGLGRGGFIQSYRGKRGGIVLAHAPKRINIARVVRYTEGPVQLVECFRSGNHCVITGPCVLAGVLEQAADSFLKVLDRFTLDDMVADRASLFARSRSSLPSRLA